MARHKIPWAKPYFSGKEKIYLDKAIVSTWISDGYFVEKFEKDLNALIGSRYGTTVSSGTAGLTLGILSLGIKPGDEVIVPGFSFAAAANVVIQTGAKPVYADIDPFTWCLDPLEVKRRVTKRTKAVIAVHAYGNVCEMNEINKIAKRRGLFLIEDAAEAAFSRYGNKHAGTFGDIGCFSFQATKTLTMGEGGFITAKNRKIHERIRLIRNHGMRKNKKYWHDAFGYNFRLTNLQAAVGCAQLEAIKEIIGKRKKRYEFYYQTLKDIPGIKFQLVNKEVNPVFWTLALKIDKRLFGKDRNFLIKYLFNQGIETRPGFYPFGAMPLYNTYKLKISDQTGKNIICLPFYPSITESEILYISDMIKRSRQR